MLISVPGETGSWLRPEPPLRLGDAVTIFAEPAVDRQIEHGEVPSAALDLPSGKTAVRAVRPWNRSVPANRGRPTSQSARRGVNAAGQALDAPIFMPMDVMVDFRKAPASGCCRRMKGERPSRRDAASKPVDLQGQPMEVREPPKVVRGQPAHLRKERARLRGEPVRWQEQPTRLRTAATGPLPGSTAHAILNSSLPVPA